MRTIQDPDLLVIWERGLQQGPMHFGLLLLQAVFPDASISDLAGLAIGERDALLLQLREQILGPEMVGLVDCPQCGETMELNLPVSEIKMEPECQPSNQLSLEDSGYEVRFRLPDSTDQEYASSFVDPVEARQAILQRCIQGAYFSDKPIETDELPAHIIDLVVESMARADPQADVLLRIKCHSCRHEWDSIFDISSFLWKELDCWAHRILLEVHTLAQSYGWSEAEILSMSPWRRRLYLEMICR